MPDAVGKMEEFVEPKARILLVDDQAENLMALEAVLASPGHELVTAASGTEALRCLLENDFAAILLDVKMPDMDGFETAALIRERERSRHTPIIFLTGMKSEEHLFRGYYVGAVDYLFKPIVPDVLRSKVAVFVELYRKNELLIRQAEALRQKYAELERLIIERRRAEEDVRRLNVELEKRVEERTAELSRSNDELRQFAYIASHDLQEPLRTVASYTQLLEKRYRSQLEGDALDFMGYIVEGVHRMHALLGDMLNYSRASEKEQELRTPVDTAFVLEGAVRNLEAAIRDSGAKITSENLPVVYGDRAQLVQVMQNLIGNAIKYRSSEPPRIFVSGEPEGRFWRVSVRDNGIGIDPQYSERVFGIFKRLHGKEVPGTGMGLAICKKIIERHGGRIWVESEPGKGSSFHFTILGSGTEAQNTPAASA
jgi:signal transduction histidine kinase